jgi:hypothetical protein
MSELNIPDGTWKEIPSGYPVAPKLFGHASILLDSNQVGGWDWVGTENLSSNLVLTYGGCDEQGVFTNNLHCFNMDSTQWQQVQWPEPQPVIETKSKYLNDNGVALTSAPPKKDGHTVVNYKSDYLFIFGGSDNTWSERNSMYQVQLRDLTWKRFDAGPYGVQPEARRDHTAVIYRNQLVIFGGRQTRSSGSCTKPPKGTVYLNDVVVWDMV